MAISKGGNSYMKTAKGGSADIDMPPLGYVLGDERTQTVVPQEQSQAQESRFGGLAEVPEESRQMMEQEQTPSQQQPEEPQYQQESTEQEEERPVKTNSREDNFRAVREAKDKAERERDAVLRQMVEMQMKMQQDAVPRYQPAQEDSYDDDDDELEINFSEDDLVDGRTVKKVADRIRRLESKLKKQNHRTREMDTEQRIKSNFPDFDRVVSPENVQRLNEEYPEVAISLRDTPDIYNKAASAYKIIKQFGYAKTAVPFDSDRAKAQANAQKPRPLASVSPQQGDSPLSHANAFANGMTDELKAQLRKEMAQARKMM